MVGPILVKAFTDTLLADLKTEEPTNDGIMVCDARSLVDGDGDWHEDDMHIL